MNISDKYFMEGETGLFPFYRTEPSAGHKSAGTETVRTGDTPVLEAAREKVVELVREETGDILFREAGESGGEKSLVGLHNISEERLLKALRLGGFANPSAAVIDISRQTHEGYGEISLVLPASMIDRHSGRNAGTWSQDAWTPVYPQIERQFGGTGGDRASGDIMSVPEEMRNETRRGINSWMDGRSADRLAYLYLHEQGKAPGLVRREARYPESLHNAVRDIMGDNSALYDVSAGKRSELLGLYIRENFSGDRTAYGKELQGKMIRLEEKISSRANPDSLVVRRARERLDALRETGYDYRELADFTENVLNDAAHAGCADDAGTTLKAREYIEMNGLKKDFDRWLDGLNERYEVKEVIFDGFTPSGMRKYIPNTLENASRFMTRLGRNAATGLGVSFSNFAAGMLKAHGSLDGIRREKGKLTTSQEDVDAFRDKWSDVFFDLGMKLQPGATGYDDYGLARLMEAAKSGNPKKYVKEEYGIDFSDTDVVRLREMIGAIRNEYPAMYFETKFERPVYLEEFAAAVVPEGTSPRITGAMDKAGLKVFTYNEGDRDSRNGALKRACDVKGVRFRLAGSREVAHGGDFSLSGDDRMAALSEYASSLAEKRHIPVRVIRSINEVGSPGIRDRILGGKDIRGWYDITSDHVCLYLPAARGKEDIERTLLHEGIAHYGLRKLAGDGHMDTFLDDVYAGCDGRTRDGIDRLAGTGMDIRTATEEYLARMAEDGTDLSLWDRVSNAFRKLLRNLGFTVDIDGRELRSMLAASGANLGRTAAVAVPESILTAKGGLELSPGYARALLREKGGGTDVTSLLVRMREAGVEPASLDGDGWKAVFSGKGMMLPDGRTLMAVKEPAGYGIRISGMDARSLKTAEMEI